MCVSRQKLSDLEKTYLNALVAKLSEASLVSEDIRSVLLSSDKPSFLLALLSSTPFRVCELDLVFNSRLSSWPPPKLFPVIDLWRIVALHPQSADLHKKSDGGWRYVALALKLAKVEDPDCQPQLALCCMRYLCNLFLHPTIRSSLLKYERQVSNDCVWSSLFVVYSTGVDGVGVVSCRQL